jgi:hypothetical protein
MSEISIGDVVARLWAVVGETAHPAEALPLPLLYLALWALRIGHASLAGPGV